MTESLNDALDRQADIISELQGAIKRNIARHPTVDEAQKIQALSKALYHNTLVWQALVEAVNESKPRRSPITTHTSSPKYEIELPIDGEDHIPPDGWSWANNGGARD